MNNIVTKNQTAKGKITYDYADLANVTAFLTAQGERWEQETVTDENGNDYIVTIKLDKNGNEIKRLRGSKIESRGLSDNNTNLQQQRGACETYARRTSLCMAYGLATADDDGNNLSYARPMITARNYAELTSMITMEQEDAILKKNKIKEIFDLPNDIAESYIKQILERKRGKEDERNHTTQNGG